MKFTKLMALALVAVMLVSVFAACGGDDKPAETSKTPETTTQPTKQTTTEPEKTTECTHERLKKNGIDKPATCTEEGSIGANCRDCGIVVNEIVPMLPHAYMETKSVDGKYTKKICAVCNDTVVVDENDNVVSDLSGIAFPTFATDFTGVTSLEAVSSLYDGFSVVLDGTFGNIVEDPNGNRYINVPTGNYGANKNGRFELTDANKALAGGFTLEFSAHYSYSSFPLVQTPLLTWVVDGTSYVMLSVDKDGKIYNSENKEIGTCAWKGWDSFKVVVKADGTYTVSQNGTNIGSGKTATTVSASSALKFFDNSSEFEGYLDNIVIYK